MNITELARILKITPQELHDCLPQLGFDIGQKAIKINSNDANRIIKEWPALKRELDKKNEEASKVEKKLADDQNQVKKVIKLPKHITVREFANLAGIPINSILTEL
ncbi:MAG: hypothetical protein NTW06_01085, partial [Candidatus Falkowbacteria bacterium]|nr:hypothetical protein [Candidatus Falkowbacteria bacterium]